MQFWIVGAVKVALLIVYYSDGTDNPKTFFATYRVCYVRSFKNSEVGLILQPSIGCVTVSGAQWEMSVSGQAWLTCDAFSLAAGQRPPQAGGGRDGGGGVDPGGGGGDLRTGGAGGASDGVQRGDGLRLLHPLLLPHRWGTPLRSVSLGWGGNYSLAPPPTYFRSILISLQYCVCGILAGFLWPNFAGSISKDRVWLRTMTLRSCASLSCSQTLAIGYGRSRVALGSPIV